MMIVLPVPPNRANDRSHWMKVMGEKQAYFAQCEKYIIAQCKKGWTFLGYDTSALYMVQRQSKLPLEFVEWDGSMDVQRMHDFDNLVARFKWPLDALVKNGIIVNDDWKHCRPRSFPTQVLKSKRKDDRVVRIFLHERSSFDEPGTQTKKKTKKEAKKS